VHICELCLLTYCFLAGKEAIYDGATLSAQFAGVSLASDVGIGGDKHSASGVLSLSEESQTDLRTPRLRSSVDIGVQISPVTADKETAFTDCSRVSLITLIGRVFSALGLYQILAMSLAKV